LQLEEILVATALATGEISVASRVVTQKKKDLRLHLPLQKQKSHLQLYLQLSQLQLHLQLKKKSQLQLHLQS
jgi:hypothetical protein